MLGVQVLLARPLNSLDCRKIYFIISVFPNDTRHMWENAVYLESDPNSSVFSHSHIRKPMLVVLISV